MKKIVIYLLYIGHQNFRKISIMTKIVLAVKRGLLSYCHKVYSRGNINQKHRNGGVMVSVLASSAVDRGFKQRIRKLVFVASPLSTQHYEKQQRLVGSESE